MEGLCSLSDLFQSSPLLQSNNRDTGFLNDPATQNYMKDSRSTKQKENVSILPYLFPFTTFKEHVLLSMAFFKLHSYLSSALSHAYTKAKVVMDTR